MEDTTSYYETSDLYFSAFLRVAGVPLVSHTVEGGRVTFLFEDQGPATMRSLKTQYFTDTAKVPALSFVQSIKMLKALVASVR